MNKRKKRIITVAAVTTLAGSNILSGCGMSGLTSAPKNLTENPQAVVCLEGAESDVEAVKQFTFGLFSENLDESNPVMSPVSAWLAMTMAGAGASGTTADEFLHVFGKNTTNTASELMSKLPADTENLSVKIANSAWVDDNLKAQESWIALVAEYYQSEILQMDLSGQEAVKRINKWAEEKSEGLIDSILDEPMGEMARLALLNAIYFKGKWQTPFDPLFTETEPFTREDGSTLDVDMMNASFETFSYVKNENLDGVVLPYVDGSYAFVALKPTAGQTVREMYQALTVEELETLMAAREDTFMNLKLPKFKTEYDKILNQDFINLGLPSAFSPETADFTNIGTSDDGLPIYISMVRQKAVIIVDEEGTEAAAVTAVVMECGSAMPLEEPIDVFFDEPFLYMIYDTQTGVPLFVGILDEPVC